jgi:hypothetical protein
VSKVEVVEVVPPPTKPAPKVPETVASAPPEPTSRIVEAITKSADTAPKVAELIPPQPKLIEAPTIKPRFEEKKEKYVEKKVEKVEAPKPVPAAAPVVA